MIEKQLNSDRDDIILTHFCSKAMEVSSGHFFHIKPKRYFTLLYIVEGKMTFSFSKSIKLVAEENDFIYIPENKSYSVVCSGNTKCRFVTTDMRIFGYWNELRSLFGFKQTVIFSDKQKEYEGYFEEYIKVYNENSAFGWMYRSSIIYKVLYKMLLKAFNIKREKGTEKIDKALKYIEQHYMEEFEVDQLALMCAMNITTFRQSFWKATGTTPLKYKNTLRAEEAMRLFMTTDLNIAEVAQRIGISDTKYFTDFFKRFTGVSPRDFYNEYRKPKL